eukprot:scaffold24846_cov33-Attheya_sp.AAC.1
MVLSPILYKTKWFCLPFRGQNGFVSRLLEDNSSVGSTTEISERYEDTSSLKYDDTSSRCISSSGSKRGVNNYYLYMPQEGDIKSHDRAVNQDPSHNQK